MFKTFRATLCRALKEKGKKDEVFHVQGMEAYRGSGDIAPLLTLVLDGGEWLTSCSGSFIPMKKSRVPIEK